MAKPAQDPSKIDPKNRKYDIVIYGATGFTGSIGASEFVKRYANSNINFKWAIAGRNNDKLTKKKKALQDEYKQALPPSFSNDKTRELRAQKQEFINNLPILIADVSNTESLRSMITSTRLVISCIGPFRLLGEKVLELCALTGTHYVDICGEPEFMEECAFKYYADAQRTGALIVSACGFDSIPSDIGCSFIDQFYTKNGAMCSSINGYLTGTCPDGYSINYTTLKAAVHGFNGVNKLRSLRKEIAEKKDYRLLRSNIPRNGTKLKVNKETYFWSDEVKKYSMLFPFADSAVVSNSQGITAALLHAQSVKNKTFPQYAAYISFNTYWNVLTAIGVGGIAKLLVNYEFGRGLLMDYPEYMTFGVFSQNGPTVKQRESQTFSFKFFAKGYSNALCQKYAYDVDKLMHLHCDFNIEASVSGTDVGYSGCAKMLIECAIVLLEEQDKINTGDLSNGIPAVTGGVFTPSTVFGNTSLVERLNEAGIRFVIEMDEDEVDEEEEQKDNDEVVVVEDNMNTKPKEDVNIEYDYHKFDNVVTEDGDDVPH